MPAQRHTISAQPQGAIDAEAAGHAADADRIATTFARELCTALGLPEAPPISVTRSPNGLVSMSIDGQSIALPAPSPVEGHSLSEQACGAIQAARSLFATRSAVDAIWRSWFNLTDRAPTPFHRLIRECCNRGRSIEGLRPHVDPASISGFDERGPEALFERAFESIEKLCVRLHVSPQIHGAWFDADGRPRIMPLAHAATMPALFDMMRDGLFYEFGAPIPIVEVLPDPRLPSRAFRIAINDLPGFACEMLPERDGLVGADAKTLQLLGLTARSAVNPANGKACGVVSLDDTSRATCTKEGLTVWCPEEVIVLHLAAELTRNLGSLICGEVFDFLGSQLEKMSPSLIGEALRRVDRVTLLRVVRLLLDEQVSIRDFRGILGAILSVEGTTAVDHSRFIVFHAGQSLLLPSPIARTPADLPPEQLAEAVRTCMKLWLSHKYTRGQSTLNVYILDPKIELVLSAPGPIARSDERRITENVHRAIGEHMPGTTPFALLTSIDCRRRLRSLLELALPTIPVLSYSELSPDLNISALGRVSFNDE